MRATLLLFMSVWLSASSPLPTLPEEDGVPSAAESPVQGEPHASITLVEFSDLQCPFSARVVPTLRRLLTMYPGQVRWVFKHYPLQFHAQAPLAHRAALAAGEQGKFWALHDLLLTHQASLHEEVLARYGAQLGLDVERFLTDLRSQKYQAVMDRDREEGVRQGVSGTPTFFINGRKLVGAQPLSAFTAIIDEELARLEQAAEAATPSRAPPAVATTAGPPEAPVQITVFADFQSPLSAATALTLKALLATHAAHIHLIFKQYPLTFHRAAPVAHEAALAAGAQGAFWAMHDVLLAHVHHLEQSDLLTYAAQLRLDMPRFTAELEAGLHRVQIQRDIAEGKRRDVRGVPTLFVNHVRLDGVPSLAQLRTLVESELRAHEVRVSAQ